MVKEAENLQQVYTKTRKVMSKPVDCKNHHAKNLEITDWMV
jgi:hypothetical protein